MSGSLVSLRVARLIGGVALFALTALGAAPIASAAPAHSDETVNPRSGDDADCDTVAGKDGPNCDGHVNRWSVGLAHSPSQSVAGSPLEVPANLIRLSVGLETPADLVADLTQALDRIR